jgi:hypothetical protein
MQFDQLKRREFIALIGGVAVACARQFNGTSDNIDGTEALLQVADISSAGVFDLNNKLVRTLWSAEKDNPNVGNLAAAWDGRLDDGSVAPAGDYTVKLLKHAITYTWEGVIGNTSPNHIDNLDYHNYGTTIRDMTITDGNHSPTGVGTEIYFIHGYDERFSTRHVTTEDNIQEAKYVLGYGFRQSYTAPVAMCTDSINVYMATFGGPAGNWVHAVKCDSGQIANNIGFKEQIGFSAGVSDPSNPTLVPPGSIGLDLTKGIQDIAVQKGGNFLFISRTEDATPTYSIWTLNKITGATLQVNLLGYLAQNRIATNPVTGESWVIHSTGGTLRDKVSKLTADGTGVLTETGVHITGLSNAVDLEVSPDGSTLLVSDGDPSQQVKAFNTSDGSMKTAFGTSGVFGVAGGYNGSPAVADNKFMFHKLPTGFTGEQGGWIAFSSDGSWWLGDSGNYRALHFSAGNSPTLIERIAFIPGYYSAHEFRGDPTRVLSDYLEWKIDYSIPIGIDNGSWTLANNWSYGIPETNQYASLKWVGVYSNGRTYAALPFASLGGTYGIFELTSSGLRDTGKKFHLQAYLDRDFNLWSVPPNSGGGGVVQFKKNAFTGFDGSNNPTWQDDPTVLPTRTVLTTETLPAKFPLVENQLARSSRFVEPLSNGVIPVYNPHSQSDQGALGNHFGGINSVTGKAMFSTHPATSPTWGGVFNLLYPEAPLFTIGYVTPIPFTGAQVGQFGGGSMLYEPGHAHVFTSYSGEDWGNNQTNVWSHWHETGLLLGRFGPPGPVFGARIITAPKLTDGEHDYTAEINAGASSILPISGYNFKGYAGLAGNAFNGGLTFVNGKYYIYHNDEWYHAGLHRWRVDNVDSLKISTQTVSWSGVYVPPTPNPYNMLEGLPFSTNNLPNNTAGWVRNPTTDITTSPGSGPYFSIRTSTFNPSPFGTQDIKFVCVLPGTLCTLQKAIPRSHTGNWTIDALTFWVIDNTGAAFNLFILDGTGKKILRVHNGPQESTSIINMWVNDIHGIANADPNGWFYYSSNLLPFVVTADVGTGKMTITYGRYSISNIGVLETGSDITSPAQLQVGCDGVTNGTIVITKLNFIE